MIWICIDANKYSQLVRVASKIILIGIIVTQCYTGTLSAKFGPNGLCLLMCYLVFYQGLSSLIISVRDHSQTTWTRFWVLYTHFPLMWTKFTLITWTIFRKFWPPTPLCHEALSNSETKEPRIFEVTQLKFTIRAT